MGKPYNSFSPDAWYEPAKLIEMSETMEPEELAEVTGLSIEEVMSALAAVGRKSPRLGACDRKTGKTITGHTERGLYLKVQILGWVDWYYFRPEAV